MREPDPGKFARGSRGTWLVAWGLAGAWLGVIDAALGLHMTPLLAGPFWERLGTMGTSIAIFALPIMLLGAVLGRCFPAWVEAHAARRERASPARRSAWRAAPLLAGLVASSTGGEHVPFHAGMSSEQPPNLILVSIDTLRADHLGTYGYSKPTSPRLDALGIEGAVFENAYAPSQWTLPSHVSMFTGLDPLAHGVLYPKQSLPLGHVTLAERLASQGYDTVGFIATRRFSFVGADRNMDQGFERYQHSPYPRRFLKGALVRWLDYAAFKYLDGGLGQAPLQVEAAVQWMQRHAERPFFLFLHLMEVHSNAEGPLAYGAPDDVALRFCPEGIGTYDGCGSSGACTSFRLYELDDGAPPQPDEMRALVCLYDGSIAFTDAALGRLFDAVDQLGLADRSLIVVTADHGEAFLEHERVLHRTVYEEVAHVPLILRGPGVAAGTRIASPVQLIDLLPTFLDLAGLPPDPGLQGRSLAGLLAGAADAAPVDALTIGSFDAQRSALVRGRWKLIFEAPGLNEELFDLASDPGEARSRAQDPAFQDLLEEMRDRAAQRMRDSIALNSDSFGGPNLREIDLSEDERAQLNALGYVIE